jgi:hypothetical protein
VALAYVAWLRARRPEVFAGKSFVLPEAGAAAEDVKAEA